jgi:exopolyphosphatase/guanosine-5'-triphosphate,3'-diphosphate pyrophosphatase
MAAWVASLHRKNETKVASPYRSILTSDEIWTVQQLGILLKIAESLDRRQNGNVYKLQFLIDKSL